MATTQPPSILDDDLQRVVTNILSNALHEGNDDDKDENYDVSDEHQAIRGRVPTAVRDKLQQAVSAALQAERRGWKEKLHGTLQEVDRQRRAVVMLEASLQQLAATCGIRPQYTAPGDMSDSGGSAAELVSKLQRYVVGLQGAARDAAKQSSLVTKVKTLEANISQMEREKCEHASQLQEKKKEILLLQKDLSSIKHQLHKLSHVVLNHNESNSSKFFLDVARPPDDMKLPPRVAARESTYSEDQLLDDVTSGEEVGARKLRGRQLQLVSEMRKTAGKRAITQCLRCQQLFKPKDNNSMACRFHNKGREVKEQYDVTGRLCKVLYKWGCCKQGLHIQGCTYGYHI